MKSGYKLIRYEMPTVRCPGFDPLTFGPYALPMPQMRVAEFMGILQERVLSLLPAGLREGIQPRIRSSWFQAHFHSPKVHYEVWLTRKTGRIEIGLHFEGPRDFSYRWLQLMAQHAPEIMDGLGPDFEFEEWTPSWTRIHQTVPYDPLSEALADEVGRRLARVIAVLQPIVEIEQANVPPDLERAGPPATDRRMRFRRRPRSA